MKATTLGEDTATATDRVARSVRLGALAGILGPLLFTLTFLLQEAFRRNEFSPVAEPVSALEAGANGWVQQLNFVVFGLMMLAFAVGLNRGLAPTRAGALGPALLGVAAVGLLLAAAFPLREDAGGETYDPGFHFVAGVTFFLSTSLAMLALSRRLAKDAHWRGLAAYTAVCGVLAFIGFVVLGRFAIPEGAPLHEYAGLAQRTVLLLVTFPCLVALAVRLRTSAFASATTTVPSSIRTREPVMNKQHIETVIVGGGQAGLSTAYHLTRRGRECLVLDRNARVGDNWRQQWDTLRLYTPAKYDGLPGFPFPAEPWEFPQKDKVADYLESYAARFELPIRTNTIVDRLESSERGGYTLTLGDDTLTCDNVVIATGTFGRTPKVPAFATDLSPEILQLHSSAYRRPDQLQPGAVLVVGASHSGGDIAFEVAPGHSTILCGPDRGQIPVRLESRRARAVLPVMLFMARHVLTRRTPIGRKMMDEVRFHGGPMLRVKRADLAGRGVERTEARVTGVSDGMPLLDDGRVVEVANVVWCTGFKQVFDWIRLPIFGEDGWPTELRGVVAHAPGLYFCGLSFQYAFSSMIFPGVGRDAEFVAKQISARMRSTTTVMQPA